MSYESALPSPFFMSLIIAVAENGVIGINNTLPWRLPEDLRYFKRITMGKPMIMGRKTFESFGKPLPGRPHIVLSRTGFDAPEGVLVCPDLSSALRTACTEAARLGIQEIMSIGGSEIFTLTLPIAQRIYKTDVHFNPTGDTFFSLPYPEDWQEESRILGEQEEDGPTYEFVTLNRKIL